MLIGIDPKVDFAFKWLFGSPRDGKLLIPFLNATLNLPPGEQITEIEILNPFNEKVSIDDKLSILDIKARDQLGRQFNVEMQMLAPIDLAQRVLYYWAELYTDQMQEGDRYQQLRPTISVCFVDGVVFRNTSQYHSTFRLRDENQGLDLTDDLSIHFFELPKFNLSADQITTPLEAWLYFLRHADRLDPAELPDTLNRDEIHRAVEALMELSEIDMQKEIYKGRLKARRDALSQAYAMAEAVAETARAEAETARARAIVVREIRLLQRLSRHDETPTEELEAMPLESLDALAEQLERELSQ